MRLKAILLVLTTIFISLFVGVRDITAQQWCGGCQVVCSGIDPETGQDLCIDGCNGCTAANCPSGQYEAPDGTCHNVGSGACECGEKADGSCKPCSNFSCPTPVNCPADRLMFQSGTVYGDNWSARCPVGTAQSSVCSDTGKDPDTGESVCIGLRVTTYDCCPVGQAYTCQIVDRGTTYTDYTPGCEDSYDTQISTQVGYYVTVWEQTCISEDKYGNCDKWNGHWAQKPVYSYTCYDIDQVCNCQTVCSNTAPTGVSVVMGSSATTANVSWTVGTGGTSQRLYVDQSQTEVNNGCTTPNACEVNATLAAGTNNYIVTGLLPNTTYYFRVTNYANSTCNVGATPVSYTTPNVTLSGRVYLDANNNCSTATPWSLGGLTVAIPSTAYTGSVGSDGRFGFYGGTTSPISLVLSGYSASYVPSTASGCNSGTTLSSVTNPSSTNYFYLTTRREAWWQAVGASVYAEGNVRSELPSASVNLIDTGSGGAVGALMKSTGSVDTGAGSVSSAGYTATTKYKGKLMNYDYFAAHMGVTPNTVNDWAVDTMNKPANNPSKVFYYINPSGSEASVSSPWTVANGESYVVFVNGDLRIASNITVANGGFLAFIVNGSVRVSPAVTDIAGLYIIDSTLITESNGTTDVAANFQGSVVAWGGVNFGRDLVASNVSQPGEKFTYRADLLNNMPDSMKVFALKWEEVVPGTFNQ